MEVNTAARESFADQVKRATSSQEYKMETKEPVSHDGIPPEQDMNNGLAIPQHLDGETPTLPEGGKAEVPPPASATEKAPTKVKLLGKEFSSMEEAMLYAETEHAKAQGYKEATEKLARKEEPEAPQAKEPDFYEEVENEIFVNPKEAIKKLHLKAVEDAKKQITEERQKQEAAQKAEADRQASWNQYWNDFYKSNSDLQDNKELVDYVTEKIWSEVADLPLTQATQRIAEETRSRIKKFRESTTPRKELPSGPAIVAGGSAGPNSAGATAATGKTNLDFISQVNKHRKRG